jgi:hypothetical protein
MTPFWKNLQQLALGQLFNGGHPAVAANTNDDAKRQAQTAKSAGNGTVGNRAPHLQIAACR